MVFRSLAGSQPGAEPASASTFPANGRGSGAGWVEGPAIDGEATAGAEVTGGRGAEEEPVEVVADTSTLVAADGTEEVEAIEDTGEGGRDRGETV